MSDRRYPSLLGVLGQARELAIQFNRDVYLYQLPGGEWAQGFYIPAEDAYLRMTPAGDVDLGCDACERVRQEREPVLPGLEGETT